MGLLGWNLIRDDVTLVGRVTSQGFSRADGDWHLGVDPDPEFENLLVNAHGETNEIPHIACEIEPANRFSSKQEEEQFFLPLVGKTVRVVGAWVEDKSHNRKTEIHPITSILYDHGTTNTGAKGSNVKRIEFFVFSDASLNVPARVPFSREDRIGRFAVDFPPPPSSGSFTRNFRVVSEVNAAASTKFEILLVPTGGLHLQHRLFGTVHSGEPPEKGFYHAIIDLKYDVA